MTTDPPPSSADTAPGRDDGVDPAPSGPDAAPEIEVLPEPDPTVWVEPTPAYLKPRFIAGVVTLALAVWLVMISWGNIGGSAPTESAGRALVPVAVARTGETTGTVEDCPASGSAVNLDAAKAIRLFLAAASGQNLAGLQVSDEVKAQLTASTPAAAASRMTRTRGFSTDSGTVSSCVETYWVDSNGIEMSTDVVVVAPAAKGWQVKQWIRGESSPVGPAESAPMPFFNGNGACGNPDRTASLQLPAGAPGDRLRHAVEEMASGSAGRALGAATPIPADVQVLSASVDGLTARVELSPTAEKLTDCAGRAAVNQITAAATTIALQSLPPDQTTTTLASKGSKSRQAAPPPVKVEVVVNGAAVTSLRP